MMPKLASEGVKIEFSDVGAALYDVILMVWAHQTFSFRKLLHYHVSSQMANITQIL